MRSVLITGATGSIGRAFVEDALTSQYTRICIFSRDEHKQAEMRAELKDPEERLRWFIGDVRDRKRLEAAMHGVGTVIHAAALKRVEVAEFDAAEVVKTNVMGTINVIEASTAAKVTKVLAISTDKAVAPVNAYGASKLLMEKLILAANNARGATGPIFAVLRCGNFLGSRGSVLPYWKSLRDKGELCLPVTDTRCTRFLLTKQDVITLIHSTLYSMKGGELVVPKLRAFRVMDLAAALSSGCYQIGLRPGERLHEFMEEGVSSENAPYLSVEELRALLTESSLA